VRTAALLGAALLAAGCGGGEDEGVPSPREARRHDWLAEREGTLTLPWRDGHESRAGRRARDCVV
jgi:hypothetical protein